MRARKCRDLAANAKDAESRRQLTDMGRELDAEADAIDAEDWASKTAQGDPAR